MQAQISKAKYSKMSHGMPQKGTSLASVQVNVIGLDVTYSPISLKVCAVGINQCAV